MASPHVAGVAALLFSKKPSASGAAVVSALTSSATDLGSRGYDTTYGHGLVSAAAAIRRL
jgi:subtilisin family serine protease